MRQEQLKVNLGRRDFRAGDLPLNSEGKNVRAVKYDTTVRAPTMMLPTTPS